MRIIGMRRIWLKAHRWLALCIGWLLALVALAGAILVVAPPLDRLMNPQLFKAAPVAADSVPPTLESIREQLSAKFGGKTSFTLRPPREPGQTLWVIVRGAPWSGTVYLNSATGAEQGRRGEYEGFVNVLFKFHSALLLQDAGKAILAWIALVYLVLLISGLVLWWPRRWPPVLKIELRKGVLRGLFDLHRTGGAVLGLLIAMSVATGAYMAWRPLGDFVTALSGEKPVKPPKIPKGESSGAAMPLDELVARAQARFPQALVGFIQLPAEADRPIRVRLRTEDDPHPNGLTSVWLHPKSGAVLAVNRWNELDPGARAVSYVFPLHTGELGGVLLEAMTCVSGLALGMLGISGIWLWWRRRA
ncbi:PepSY domain-containing protein [Herbaspirillum sp. HC18]|nr:PepSY domain-containing protein [Herbaspirillum sp. HC18]